MEAGDVLLERPTPVQSRAGDIATWQATHLRVRDAGQAMAFWRDLLGLQVRATSGDQVALGVEDADLIVLHEGASRPVPSEHAGLYHVALHLPSARDFAAMLARLVRRGADPRPTDHLLHWAMYLWDDDGIGVELSFETPDRFDRVLPGGRRPSLLDTDGAPHGAVEPLDVAAILGSVGPPPADGPMPAGTRIGHNHLHVGDLRAAVAFYELLGFGVNPALMSSMEDFNAGGSFPHRLAVNEWAGHGAPPAPHDAAGLHHMQLAYADPSAMREAVRDLGDAGYAPAGEGTSAVYADPAGNLIALSAPTT